MAWFAMRHCALFKVSQPFVERRLQIEHGLGRPAATDKKRLESNNAKKSDRCVSGESLKKSAFVGENLTLSTGTQTGGAGGVSS
jgi:hypothetical protein